MTSLLKKAIFIIGPNKEKIPWLFVLFMVLSSFEIIGLSLVASFVGLFFESELPLPRFLNDFKSSIKLTFIEFDARYVIGVLVIIVYFVKTLVTLLILHNINSIANFTTVYLRIKLLESFMKLSNKIYIKKSSSEYVYSILDLASQFSGMVLKPALKLASDLFVILLIFAFLIYLFGGLIFAGSLIILSFIFAYYKIFSSKQKAYGRIFNDASRTIIKIVNEAVNGIKEIRIFKLEKFFMSRLNLVSVDFAVSSNKAQFISIAPRYLIEFFFVTTFVVVFLFIFFLNGEIGSSVSSFGIIGLAMIRVLPQFGNLANSVSSLRFHSDSVDKLFEEIKFFEENQKNNKILSKRKIAFEKLEIEDVSLCLPWL